MHCACAAELAVVENTARTSSGDPEAGKFIAAMVEMRENLDQRKKPQSQSVAETHGSAIRG